MIRAALLILLLAGCAAVPVVTYRDADAPFASTTRFDPARYAGRWYEIARFPVAFQAGCAATTADYALLPDGRFSVVNTCRQAGPEGPVRRVEGSATVVGPGRLSVRLGPGPAPAPYWVLWVDESYRTAVVGVPSGSAGWILNRDPTIPQDRLRAAIEVLAFNGYDVRRLEYVEH